MDHGCTGLGMSNASAAGRLDVQGVMHMQSWGVLRDVFCITV
jgi:hypothetical protein